MGAMTLRYGSSGRDVQQLQQLLNGVLRHGRPLAVDGHYARSTEAAVRSYQASVGLAVDGVAGPDTWRALGKGLARPHRTAHVTGQESFPGAPWMAIAMRMVDRVKEAADTFFHASADPHASPDSECGVVRHPLPARGDPPWMVVAMREVGQKETEGPADNPRILQYHAATTLRARSEATPWCSSFVNWCMQQAGITGTKSAAAISWMHWGKPSAARPGAITIIFNPKAAGSRLTASGYHVGFLLEEGPSYYNLLWGNQHDQVRSWKFAKASNRLVGYRWPNP